jgi:hypothetical protein
MIDPLENPMAMMGEMLDAAYKAAIDELAKRCKRFGYDQAYFDTKLDLSFRVLGTTFERLEDYKASKEFSIEQKEAE